jgi:hypothetical protein
MGTYIIIGSPQDFALHGYFDPHYAGDHDNRKSCTSYSFILAKGVVAWCSKQQSCIANLIIEAEFVGMAKSIKETIWLCHLLHNLGFPQHALTIILFDNQGDIQLIKNLKYHKRTKHIETNYYLILEKHSRKQIDVHYIHTKQQLVELLTKALPRELLQCLQGLITPLC